MNSKIGSRETSAAIIIFSLSPVIPVLVGGTSSILGTGAWINCLFCFALSLLLLLSVKLYFSVCPNQNIIDSCTQCFGNVASAMVAIVFLGLIFASVVFGVSFYSSDISSLTLGAVDSLSSRLLFCLAGGIVAWLGIEALTRQSYIILILSIVLIALVVTSCFRGINPDNLHPVLGTSVKGTFSHFMNLSVYMGIAPFLLICDCISIKKTTYKCALRSMVWAFGIATVLFLLYALTVPYPMGKMFSHSMQAIFASASSGELLHRFELLLACVSTLFAIVISAFSLAVCSRVISRLCKVDDERPFVLILAVLLYNLSAIKFSASVYILVCISLSILSVFVPLVITLFNYKKGE